mmetsp:Transcript_23407/g.31363  ORF Transcript_23407/g.31363 Transcript_23407/m.31363 type:complete len:126 (-) Transcript_23407:996-1373(-)|eukprot:CAMPEP_0185594648 /NCGR_PEP_ID=MMETSP0434-20130131/75730_1 /TAXON_ID=626734 ORGANISM="Favella taraikaensis, Strain Fe Narragansett Bay" /NCGR_SAMPLE_ID=MMETSP0434 /ASSEMBLY_ACC=CAM_ASM_000379 /LENGTH=125 /DNA_ID=CAMNT_0028222137 /DNA_START=1831 /DNA_END=2208 /DNA_ORIENTATION=+
MAAEIKVNKTKQRSNENSAIARESKGMSDAQNMSPNHYDMRMPRSPAKPKYDTRDEETNLNQRKAYNAKFEFFTKPLGPGHYDPASDLTKPKKQGAGWGAARAQARAEPVPRNLAAQPGPGQYAN